MNEKLKTAVTEKLDDLTDEAGRQLVDYMEFLECFDCIWIREQTTFERLAENVEGTLRGSRLGDAAIKGTEGLLDAAGSVARGVAAAGQAVLDELQQVAGDSSKEPQRSAEETDSSPEDEVATGSEEDARAVDEGKATDDEAKTAQARHEDDNEEPG